MHPCVILPDIPQHSPTQWPASPAPRVAAYFCAAAVSLAAFATEQEKPAAAPQPTTQPAPLPFVAGSFTLVVLPDIQNYTEAFPDLLEQQTRWIADHRKDLNIQFVVPLGDLTNRNSPEQWEVVRKAFHTLDGVVPYALVTGNHDYGHDGDTSSRDSGLNKAFPVADWKQRPTFGGLYEPERLDNTYHLFSAGGKEWLMLALEFGPRDPVVQWAGTVLDKYPQRRAIVVTHAYLYSDNTRYDHVQRPKHHWNPYSYPSVKLPGGTNDGEDLWQKLISPRDNVDFVLCGHVLNTGTGRLASVNPHGHTVHELMANYQDRPKGGEGYLRLMEFLPDGQSVQVKTYSPVLDKYLTDETQQFVVKLAETVKAKP